MKKVLLGMLVVIMSQAAFSAPGKAVEAKAKAVESISERLKKAREAGKEDSVLNEHLAKSMDQVVADVGGSASSKDLVTLVKADISSNGKETMNLIITLHEAIKNKTADAEQAKATIEFLSMSGDSIGKKMGTQPGETSAKRDVRITKEHQAALEIAPGMARVQTLSSAKAKEFVQAFKIAILTESPLVALDIANTKIGKKIEIEQLKNCIL